MLFNFMYVNALKLNIFTIHNAIKNNKIYDDAFFEFIHVTESNTSLYIAINVTSTWSFLLCYFMHKQNKKRK